ncbi:nuclear transport factor 2-like [Wolffia australiana]
MAMDQEQRPASHAVMVADAFVRQYYHILFHSPELVHRFYQDQSKLGRSDGSGSMVTVTTMKAIDEKILASETTKFQSEVETINAQESFKGGVLILVTGFLTGLKNSRRNFAQTFFLAPQEKGYFVLNDILRYVSTSPQHNSKLPPTVDTQESYNGGVLMLMTGHLSGVDKIKGFAQSFFLAPQEKGYFVLNDIFKGEETIHQVKQVKPDAPEVPEQEFLSPAVEENSKPKAESLGRKADEPSVIAVEKPLDLKEALVVDREAPHSKSSVVEKVAVPDSKVAASQGDGAKKSYASIVKVLKENAVVSSTFVAPPLKPTKTNPPESQISEASESPAAAIQHASENSEVRELEDVSSIYVKNLPLNATPAQLEEEFKRFGVIKPGGVQVRSNKLQGFCFGFVEYESASSVQVAIEGSPVLIGGRQAHVEEKRPSGSRIGGRGRHVGGRGGYRSEGGRGRGGFYGNGRGGYGRGDFGGWAGGSGRGGSFYHQRMDGGSRANPPVDAPSSSSFKEVPASA